MKLLLDSCLWGGTKVELEAAGHDVVFAREWPEDPGDEEILARAHRDGRVLVTLDRDFGELAVAQKAPHAGIVRLVKIPYRDHARLIMQAVNANAAALAGGAIVTVSAGRMRIRPLEGESE